MVLDRIQAVGLFICVDVPLVQFGNTCYCNSVIQALYFCLPFRQHCLQYLARFRGLPFHP